MRRIYAELLPHEEVVRPRVTQLLRAFGLELVLAVRPGDVAGLDETLAALARAEVPVVLWPMAADDDGRWASLEAAPAWATHARGVLGAVARGGGAPGARLARGVLLDLEPPLARLRAVLAGRTAREVGEASRALVRGAAPPPLARARAMGELEGVVAEARGLGLGVSAAVVPPLIFGGARAARAWETLFGTPCAAFAPDDVSVMAYTTLLEGYSRGLVTRADARALLAGLALRATAAGGLGGRVGLSLGAVGPGALGDEPTYPGPDELADDVEIARAGGAADLALFELAGVLRRAPAEGWLEAFVHGAAARPGALASGARSAPRRVRLALAVADGLSRVIGRIAAGETRG